MRKSCCEWRTTSTRQAHRSRHADCSPLPPSAQRKSAPQTRPAPHPTPARRSPASPSQEPATDPGPAPQPASKPFLDPGTRPNRQQTTVATLDRLGALVGSPGSGPNWHPRLPRRRPGTDPRQHAYALRAPQPSPARSQQAQPGGSPGQHPSPPRLASHACHAPQATSPAQKRINASATERAPIACLRTAECNRPLGLASCGANLRLEHPQERRIPRSLTAIRLLSTAESHTLHP